MKILAITGKKAEKAVRESVGQYADLLVCNIKVASFITPKILRKRLGETDINIKNYDMILIPGLIKASFEELEEDLRMPIRLGPKNAYDLRYILPEADRIEFSKEVPACELLKNVRREEAEREILNLEKSAKSAFKLKELKIGGSSRMKVLAEIVGADKYEREDLSIKIRDYLREGADMIDLGISMDADVDDVERSIDVALGFDLPFSIDTSVPEFLLSGCGRADMLLSANKEILDGIGEKIAEADSAVTIIAEEDSDLDENLNLARELGIKKIVADPILNHVGEGLVASLERYKKIREKFKDIPLFFGVGNVSELIDADSVGVNAILSGLASELNADILFTPEYSQKCFGSIYELRRASEMMFLSENRGMPPKDLGIDLLLFKEKRKRMDFFQTTKIVAAKEKKEWKIDPLGGFLINVKDGWIYAIHRRCTILGKGAKEIMDTIIEKDLASSKEHIAYLGRELMKAEICMKLGRSYLQDEEFEYVYPFEGKDE